MTRLIVSLKGVFDNIGLCYIPVVIACWNIHAEVALLRRNKSIVRVRPGIYRLFCLKEHKVTQNSAVSLWYSTSYDNQHMFHVARQAREVNWA